MKIDVFYTPLGLNAGISPAGRWSSLMCSRATSTIVMALCRRSEGGGAGGELRGGRAPHLEPRKERDRAGRGAAHGVKIEGFALGNSPREDDAGSGRRARRCFWPPRTAPRRSWRRRVGIPSWSRPRSTSVQSPNGRAISSRSGASWSSSARVAKSNSRSRMPIRPVA